MMPFQESHRTRFVEDWAKTRQAKVRYIMLRGVLLWGICISSVTYFFSINFRPEAFALKQYLLYLFFWSLGGIWVALLQFRAKERLYQRLLQDKSAGRKT
ncbi:hypothetical protein SAMN05421823_10845 [Catalinimonas alkaloidigena]|uniref:2TM domain-containing protein n=1 Tax=Catalinimonas alkaloidigena TaxID=1075417 RepID=A0A1G9MPA2_9BACT|nr:hypothetical protein [Catalinimonas alkaloidigena]SDL76049.1 hypothetical protein SAMN05421823_10845 [Catalinimonas alkaloidigena]